MTNEMTARATTAITSRATVCSLGRRAVTGTGAGGGAAALGVLATFRLAPREDGCSATAAHALKSTGSARVIHRLN